MNFEQTEILLKKINRLYEIIKSFGEASGTENDLLKAYVIDLYEAVAMAEIETPADLNEKKMKEKIKKIKKQEKKLKKQIELKKRNDELGLEEDKIEKTIEESIEVVAEEEIAPEEKTVQEDIADPAISQDMIDLFEFSNNSELSDKLANAPVKDLTKAMGINEKIFTIKELFGGSQEEMDNMLLALNGLSEFGEAKNILIRSVASKYDWTETAKVKKAKNFIKLVRRRYI